MWETYSGECLYPASPILALFLSLASIYVLLVNASRPEPCRSSPPDTPLPPVAKGGRWVFFHPIIPWQVPPLPALYLIRGRSSPQYCQR